MLEIANDDKDRSRIEAQRQRLESKVKLRDDQREDIVNEERKDNEKNEPNKKEKMKSNTDLNDFNEDDLKELFADPVQEPSQATFEDIDAGMDISGDENEQFVGDIPLLNEDVVMSEDEELPMAYSRSGSGERSRVPTDEAAAPKPCRGRQEEPQDDHPAVRAGPQSVDKREREGAVDDLDSEDDGEPWAKKTRQASLLSQAKLRTSVGRALAGEEDERDSKQRLYACIKAFDEAKSKPDVKQILRDLDKEGNFKLPKNRRQRRTAIQEMRNHVSEVYSPPRISEMAGKMGMAQGWALDLTTVDPDDGQPWNFNMKDKKNKAMNKLKEDKPFMLVVSPMCGPFSALQGLFNYPGLNEQEVKDKLRSAIEHVNFALKLCLEQYRSGRLFLFEHPSGASSWTLSSIRSVMELEGVFTTKFDFCMVGIKTTSEKGEEMHAKKRTTIMTNSPAISSVLRDAQCRGEHPHQPLLGDRAGPCQEYPEKFTKLICEGVRRELDSEAWRGKMADIFDISKPFGSLMKIQAKMAEPAEAPEEEDGYFDDLYRDMEFVDDVTGAPLDKA